MSESACFARPSFAVCLVLALAACGGGGGSGGGGGGGGTPNPPPGSNPPPAPNLSPRLAKHNVDQRAVQFHAIDYDVSQGGTTFTDPENGPIRYEITLGHVYNPYDDPDPPHGVRVVGTRIVGAPETTDTITVQVRGVDSSGQSDSDYFIFSVAPNGAPRVARPREDVVAQPGSTITVDASLGGSRFADPEGDRLTYQVSLRGHAGLLANGTQVTGRLDAGNAVEVTITATDPFGANTSHAFLIAAPLPPPGAPVRPAIPFTYTTPTADMPYVYRLDHAFFDTEMPANATTDAGAALGRVLFYDRRLSITNAKACASCHEQSHGFAAPERFSVGVIGTPLARNSMALANARYSIHRSWFADMRAGSLQEVARTALENTDELGMTSAMLVEKLRATDFYPALFEAAFGTPEISEPRIFAALEQYLQSLVSYRSKFDRAVLSPDNTAIDPSLALDAQEMRGRELFNGAAGIPCVMCHDGQSLMNQWQANNGIDAEPTDPGTTIPALQRDGTRGIFRASALKNIALTAPYMHDGRFATLREVIDHYDHGIQDSPNLDGMLRGLDGKVRHMDLSEADKDALEAFLHTLTDDEMISDPKFSDPFQ